MARAGCRAENGETLRSHHTSRQRHLMLFSELHHGMPGRVTVEDPTRFLQSASSLRKVTKPCAGQNASSEVVNLFTSLRSHS